MSCEENDPVDVASDPVSEPDGVENDQAPAINSVYKHLVYGLSLPERALRGTSGMIGGAIRESAALLVPSAFRNSRSYQSFVEQMLDFMINDIAGVPRGEAQSNEPEVENYVARKSVSSFVDLAGMATLHFSPLTVMAIVSDMAYGSNAYLRELSTELKKEGIISQDSTIDSTADLLDAIGNAAGKTADALDTPPLSVSGMRETIEQTRDAVAAIDPAKLIPLSEIDRTWTEMSVMAKKEKVSLFEISSAMTLYSLDRMSAVTQGALSTIRVTGNMFDRHIFEHYRTSLFEIGERGVYTILAESSKPYIDALWHNFASDRQTITEDLVSGKLIGKAWQGMKGIVGFGKKTEPTDDGNADDDRPANDHSTAPED